MNRFLTVGLWGLGAAAIHLLFFLAVGLANGGSIDPIISIHDGPFYVSHVADPLLLDPPEWWDNVAYRALRYGVVVVAQPLRWLGPTGALVAVNLVAIGVGSVLMRHLAIRHGASPFRAWLIWVGNPGALVATALLLPDTLAWVAILLSLWCLQHERTGWSAFFAVVAVTTKEASLAALAIPAFMLLRTRGWRAFLPSGAALLVHLAGYIYVIARFGESLHGSLVAWPLVGWLEVLPGWMDRSLFVVTAGVFFLLSSIFVIVRWLQTRSYYLGAAAGQAALSFFLAPVVLDPIANTTRIGGLYWPLLMATDSVDISTRSVAPTDPTPPGMSVAASTLKGDVRPPEDIRDS